MILPRFDILIPETVDEACAMLAEHTDRGVRILAGGTDLLVDLRRPIIPHHVPRCDGCATHSKGGILTTVECGTGDQDTLMSAGGPARATLKDNRKASPAFLLSLHKVKSLRSIEPLSGGGLKVGALTTIADLERSRELRTGWTALSEGADSLGSPLVRNRGTIGGNIANARPAADTAIPTVALNAQLTLKSSTGSRTVAAENFATGPGASIMGENEILTEILLPPSLPHSGSAYYKLANRKALEISTVGVAVWLALEEPDGPVVDVRVALGAVGPTPILAVSVKDELAGKIPDDQTIMKAAKAAASDATPIDDHRGSAWYRVQMVELLTARLLKACVKRARGDQ
jgi:carbon-monoxide dehydrogenase medium subunit